MARRRSGKKIDFVHWLGFSNAVGAHAAGSTARELVAAQHLPETLMRTRGEALVYLDGVSAPGGLAIVSMGLILVPEGTGSTVLWSPLTDSDAPWFWYDSFHIGYEEAVVDVVDIPGITSARRVIDSKAMRINKNMEIQWVIENTTLQSAISVNVSVSGRFLAGT